MRQRVALIAIIVACGSAVAFSQPQLEFKSRELKEGRNYTDHITALLAVGESSGTVTYEYPIEVAPGRGVTPKIALEYSSHGGQSEYGYGWALTMPIVERTERHGPMGGVPLGGYTESYQYRNGHETAELVPIGAGPDGTTEYHEYQEHSFNRYLFDGTKNAWRILKLDGTRIELGVGTGYRRGPDPTSFSGTATWLPYRIYDTHNNYAEYVYGTGPDGNRRLVEVMYDGNLTTGQTPNLTVQLNWTTHWGTAAPVPLSYRSGFLRAFGQDALSSIVVSAPAHATGASPATVPASSPTAKTYTFTYTEAGDVPWDKMFYLNEASLAGFPKVVFAYSNPWESSSAEHQQTFTPSDPDFPAYLGHTSIQVNGDGSSTSRTNMVAADLNSDGATDFIDVSSGAPVVWINTGTGFQKQYWNGLQAYGVPLPENALRIVNDHPNVSLDTIQDFFDLDGDGYPDIVYVNSDTSYHVAYCPGTGSGFGMCIDYGAGVLGPGVLRSEDRHFSPYSATTVDIADFDGDGDPDFLELEGSTLVIHRNLGYAHAFVDINTAMPPTGSLPWPNALRITVLSPGDGSDLIMLAETKDINGDGLPDFLTSPDPNDTSQIWVSYGNGYGFDPNQTQLIGGPPVLGAGISDGGNYISSDDLVDVNGDGMPDIVHMECRTLQPDFGILRVRFNNGGVWDTLEHDYSLSPSPESPLYDSLCPDRTTSLNSGTESAITSMFSDFDGDGSPDIVSADIDPISPYRTVLVREFNYIAPRKLVTATSLSNNHQMSVTYAAALGQTPYPVHVPTLIVRQRTPLYPGEPARQTTFSTQYQYSSTFYDRDNRMFTGFSQVSRTDDTFGAVTMSLYDTDFIGSGLLTLRYKINQIASGTYTAVVNSYAFDTLPGNRYWARLYEKDEYNGFRDYETDYTGYDGFGQLTDWTEIGDPYDNSDNIVHHRTYVTRSQDEFFTLDLVSTETGSSITLGPLSTTRYYYDDPNTLGATPTYGDLRKVEHEQTNGQYVNHQYTYDSYGMVATETDEGGTTTSYGYDSTYHYYRVQSTDPVGTVYKSFHALTGEVADTCGPQYDGSSWKCSRVEVDVLGRTTNTYVPTLTGNTYGKQLLAAFTYDDVDYPLAMTEVLRGESHRVQYRDGFGNPTEQRIEVTTNNYRVLDTAYDALGTPLRAELPRRENGAAYSHAPISSEGWTYLYDYAHGSLEQVTYPRDPGDNSPPATASRVIRDTDILMTDEDGRGTDYNLNYQNRVSSIVRWGGGGTGDAITSFTYNTRGDILTVTDPTSLVTTYGRNLLGWVGQLTTPDNQTWVYTHNARGQLLTSQDPRGVLVTNTYDTAGRLYHVLSSGEPSGVRHVDATYTYWDASSSTNLGWLATEVSDGITTQYSYTPEGDVQQLGIAYGSQGGSIWFQYDPGSRLANALFPDDQSIVYHYNLDDSVEHAGWGFLFGESASAASYLYEDDGQPSSLTNGYGLDETYAYDARGRLVSVASANTMSGYGDLVDDRLALSKASLVNELDRYGLAPGLVQRTSPDVFIPTVDVRGQLTHVTKNGTQFADYAYDLAGRLAVFNESPNTVSCTTTFSADKTTARTFGANESRSWTYDASGHVTHDDHSLFGSVVGYRDHTWDALGRYTQTSGTSGSTTYYYTPRGQLARVTGPGEAPSTSDMLQLGEWARLDLTTGNWIDRVLVNGHVVGEHNGPRFEMPHRTYDGSVLAVTNDLGQVIRQEEFLPYGLRSGGTADGVFEEHFQGAREDKLLVAGTRAYDASGGIWLSRDQFALTRPAVLITQPALQSFYEFDFANPYSFRDPSGADPECVGEQCGKNAQYRVNVDAALSGCGAGGTCAMLSEHFGDNILSSLPKAAAQSFSTPDQDPITLGFEKLVEVLHSPALGPIGPMLDTLTAYAGISGALSAVGVLGAADAAATSGAAADTVTMYRTMSAENFSELVSTGRLPATGETVISPSLEAASEYEGVTVQFEIDQEAVSSLRDIGVRNSGLGGAYQDLPVVKSGWTYSNAFFKLEGGVVNIGLGKGLALDTFNYYMVSFTVP